jgi:sarcosine oxidase subunit gamma
MPTGSDCVAEPNDAQIGSIRPGHYGAGGTGVELAAATIGAVWNVQGHPARGGWVEETRRLFGVALPLAPGTAVRTARVAALWLGPASWLLVARSAAALVDYAPTRDALNATGGALFDLSASRVAWTISGPRAADVLAKGCPLDFHARAFAAGTCAQSVFGRINVLIDKRDDEPTFTAMVARSFERDLWHALCEASAQYGYRVAPAAPFG